MSPYTPPERGDHMPDPDPDPDPEKHDFVLVAGTLGSVWHIPHPKERSKPVCMRVRAGERQYRRRDPGVLSDRFDPCQVCHKPRHKVIPSGGEGKPRLSKVLSDMDPDDLGNGRGRGSSE